MSWEGAWKKSWHRSPWRRRAWRFEFKPTHGPREGRIRSEFLLAPNVGEDLKPLEKIASGDELSRVALALKTCTGSRGTSAVPVTLVFDEVDAGVGGAASGRAAARSSHDSQVICVTHLPQVWQVRGSCYFSKAAAKGRTITTIVELTPRAAHAGNRTHAFGRACDARGVAAGRAVEEAGHGLKAGENLAGELRYALCRNSRRTLSRRGCGSGGWNATGHRYLGDRLRSAEASLSQQPEWTGYPCVLGLRGSSGTRGVPGCLRVGRRDQGRQPLLR